MELTAMEEVGSWRNLERREGGRGPGPRLLRRGLQERRLNQPGNCKEEPIKVKSGKWGVLTLSKLRQAGKRRA